MFRIEASFDQARDVSRQQSFEFCRVIEEAVRILRRPVFAMQRFFNEIFKRPQPLCVLSCIAGNIGNVSLLR